MLVALQTSLVRMDCLGLGLSRSFEISQLLRLRVRPRVIGWKFGESDM